jgi:hypothetical protein
MDHFIISLNLNLAENFISQLKYKIMNRKERKLTSLAQLKAALKWEWNAYS